MSGRSQSVLDEVVVAGERQGLKMLPALMKPFRMGVVKELVAGLGLSAAAPAASRRPEMPRRSSAAPDAAECSPDFRGLQRALSQSSVRPALCHATLTEN